MPTAYDAAINAIGMREQPGIASAWPDIVPALNDVYTTRVANLPFIPSGWLSEAKRLNGVNGSIILPIPAQRADGSAVSGLPAWLDTNEKRASWYAISKNVQSAYVKFAAGKAEEGRAELERLQADADFWNSALITAAIRVQEGAKEAASFVGNKLLFPILLGAGVVGAALLYVKVKK